MMATLADAVKALALLATASAMLVGWLGDFISMRYLGCLFPFQKHLLQKLFLPTLFQTAPKFPTSHYPAYQLKIVTVKSLRLKCFCHFPCSILSCFDMGRI